jgi:hypothetical protein
MSTMLSRSGRSNPDGKLTQRFDVPVSEELNEAVIALATIEGISKAEWLRRLIERTVWGELSMLRRVSGRHGSDQLDSDPRNVP